MDARESALERLGLHLAVADWYIVAPLHYWNKGRPYLKASSGGLPAASEFTRHSLCVVNYAQTSKPVAGGPGAAEAVLEKGSMVRWAPDSAWAGVVALALPPEAPSAALPARDAPRLRQRVKGRRAAQGPPAAAQTAASAPLLHDAAAAEPEPEAHPAAPMPFSGHENLGDVGGAAGASSSGQAA
eukprot:15470416-Alexandrium_andersonii.AAC.1